MFRVRNLPCVLLAFLGLPGGAAAQDAPLRITLPEAISRAERESLRLAELRARVDSARAVEAGAEAADRPLVALLAGYTRTNHVDEFALAVPNQPLRVLYPDVPDNYRSRIDLQWPIYTAGRTRALTAAAGAEREAIGFDLAASRADIRLDAVRAFWALVTAIETEDVLTRALASIDAHVRDLESRLDQGFIPPNDVLSAEAQRSRQRLTAIEARHRRAIAEADLRRAIGEDTARRIEPVIPPDLPAPVPGDGADLAREAVEQRPERRALAARTDAAAQREAAIAAGARPQVALGTGYDYARPNPRIFPRLDAWRHAWDVSVSLSWSMWDSGRRRAEQAEAGAMRRALAARAADFDRQLVFEVEQRRLEVASAEAAIGTAEDGVRAAVEARRVLGERFAAGVATSAEVLDAETAVLLAELDRTRAIATLRLAVATLERALGR